MTSHPYVNPSTYPHIKKKEEKKRKKANKEGCKERKKEIKSLHCFTKMKEKRKKVISPPLPLLIHSFLPSPSQETTTHHTTAPENHNFMCTRAVHIHTPLSVSRLLGKARHSRGVNHPQTYANPKGMRQCPQNPPLTPPVLSFASLHTSQHRNT